MGDPGRDRLRVYGQVSGQLSRQWFEKRSASRDYWYPGPLTAEKGWGTCADVGPTHYTSPDNAFTGTTRLLRSTPTYLYIRLPEHSNAVLTGILRGIP
jgi:hypothetical protein